MSNPTYNDGTIPYGSRTVAVLRNGQALGTYILENVSPKRPDKIIKRMDEKGGPNGSIGVPDFVEGSAVAQLATTSTPHIESGDTFTATFVVNVGVETFIFHSCENPETADGYKKQNVQFIKKYN